LGAATSALGRPDEGIRQMADGIEQYQDLRTPPVFWPFIRFMQAGAYLDAGTPGPGFRLADEALEVGGPDSVPAPLVHIVRGDLSLLGPEPDVQAATASYEYAAALAERFDARMPQLRAASRLVRVATDTDRSARREALRAVHLSFTEGFSAPDLVEAAELLG
jgi:hypothetical protein